MSNLDLNAAKRIIYMLSNFYPERMGQCLIVSAPIIFSAVWAVIRPWLSRRTQTKVQFCKAEELGRWIAPVALPSFWGGLDQTVYSERYVALSLACMSGLPFKARRAPPTPSLMLQSPHSHQRSQASSCCQCQLSCCELSSLSRFNCCHVGCVTCGSLPCVACGSLPSSPAALPAVFPRSAILILALVCACGWMRGLRLRGNRDVDQGAAPTA
jgi:hypothetical protein